MVSIKRNIKDTIFYHSFKFLLQFPSLCFIKPQKLNGIINKYEIKKRKLKLFSYPTSISINISNVCSLNCKYCYCDNTKMNDKNWLKPEIFKKMKWLKFISNIFLFGGFGDPLVNPFFPKIAKEVKKIAPNSKVMIYTNGLMLNSANIDAIVKYIDYVHISINSLNQETCDKFAKGYDVKRIKNNLNQLSQKKPQSLEVAFSMICMKSNADDYFSLIDLASQLNFQKILLSALVVFPNHEEYGEKEWIDIEKIPMQELENYAIKKGIDLIYADYDPPKKCNEPWTTGFIANNQVGEKILLFCCSCLYPNIFLSDDVYTNFKKTWNSERMQYIRKTINEKPELQNTLCKLCRKFNRKDKDWVSQVKKLSGNCEDIVFPNDDYPHVFSKIKIN